jgi:hypothetical protein
MTKRIEVTVTVGDKKISIEGPEDFVRGEVERFAGLSADQNSQKSTVAQPRPPATTPVTEREFIAEKRPNGHVETVAVIAYFLTQNGTPEFTPDEIRRAYLRAHIKPPKVVAQALRDAKNLNDYIEQGSKKGTFRLSAHGERTVIFDLPRKEHKTGA